MKAALWWLLLAIAFWVGAFTLLIHEDGMWLASLLLGVVAGVQALDEETKGAKP